MKEKEIDKIVALLDSDALERRVAAAIVLGELEAKGPEVMKGLVKLLGTDVPVLQKHALDAIGRIGAKKALPSIFPLLVASAAEVRDAAGRAVASVGEEAVPIVKDRMAGAGPDERRALDAVLAEIGGKDAFSELLRGLGSADAEASKNAALAVRQHVKGADGRQKKAYATATLKFLEQLEKKKGEKNVHAIAAALKLLGFLEDERSVPVLVEHAADESEAPAVRMEAILALRFSLKNPTSSIVEALVKGAFDKDRTLSQAALHTVGSLTLSGDAVKKLAPLVTHPEPERACFAIEHVSRQKGPEATAVLVKALASRDKRVLETAAKALGAREDATPALAKALIETDSPDRAWAIRNVLKPRAKKISPALRKQIVEIALDRVRESDRGFEAHLDVAREADPQAVAEGLREIAQKAKKSKNTEKAHAVLSLLCKSDKATDDDRFTLAVLDLHKSARDTAPGARATDEALVRLGRLLDGGFDVAQALKKEKSVELDELYYVGFHFTERRQPLGEELLSLVADRGGRSKIAKMAKNKLKLAGGAMA